METYKNDYSEKEDETLWELHEIRHKIHKELEKKPIKKINSEALKKYQSWTQCFPSNFLK